MEGICPGCVQAVHRPCTGRAPAVHPQIYLVFSGVRFTLYRPGGIPGPKIKKVTWCQCFYSIIWVQRGRYKGVGLFRYKGVEGQNLTPELGKKLVRQAPCGMPEPGNQESDLVSMFLLHYLGPKGALPGVKTFLLQGCRRSECSPHPRGCTAGARPVHGRCTPVHGRCTAGARPVHGLDTAGADSLRRGPLERGSHRGR